MSSYRDDVNEIAVASDSTWTRVKTIAESTARVRDVLLFGLVLVLNEHAVARDVVIDKVSHVTVEHALGSDQVMDRATVKTLVAERARGGDVLTGRARAWLVETASASDVLLTGTRVLLIENAAARDQILSQRRARQVVAERARGGDALLTRASTLVQDQAQGADQLLGRARQKALVLEQAVLTDQVLGAANAPAVVLIERARASAEAFGQMLARDLLVDAAVAWDEPLQFGNEHGQAWTCDPMSWSMSRYAPFTFTGLVVIDGKLYATRSDGVYALDGDEETIEAEIRTGKLDMTGSVLAHPVQSLVEYELQGEAWLDVVETQGGAQAKTFSYALPDKPADFLTNSRFTMGRGLRGRHFAYSLRLTGQSAYINDWSVTLAPSKRSI